MSKCNRCGKVNVDIHTCSPLPAWRDGFEYACKLADNKIGQFYCDVLNTANFLSAVYALDKVMRLLKQIKLEQLGGDNKDESKV